MPDPSYDLEFSSTFKRQIASDKISLSVIDAALAFITDELAANPYRVGKRLQLPPLQGKFSARRADYRIIYSIDQRRRRVTILDLSHRSDAYYS